MNLPYNNVVICFINLTYNIDQETWKYNDCCLTYGSWQQINEENLIEIILHIKNFFLQEGPRFLYLIENNSLYEIKKINNIRPNTYVLHLKKTYYQMTQDDATKIIQEYT